MAQVAVRVEIDDGAGNFSTIARWHSAAWKLPAIALTDIPDAEITLPNQGGRNAQWVAGRRVRIYRNGELEFDGIIQPRKLMKSSSASSKAQIHAIHRAYLRLQRFYCNSYDYAESGATIFGTTVNPWKYRVFRDVTQSVTSTGEFPAVDGVRPDQVFECLIGTRFIWQEFFEDTSALLETTTLGNTATLNVYRDGPSSQVRSHLQLTRSGTSAFASTGTIESIPLQNGDPNIAAMGEIKTVTITLWGKRDAAGNNPAVHVCRNARAGTRTYTNAGTPTYTANAKNSLDKWVYTVDISADGASVKNELGYKIVLSGNGSATTRVDYLMINCVTTSDIGFTLGAIEDYVDGSGTESGSATLRDGVNFYDGDFLGKIRLEAVEELRKATVSDDSNPNPNWDIWFTPELDAFFAQRRGLDKSREYRFGGDEGQLTVLEHEFDGSQIYYQVIAYGAGSGEAATRIVSKAEYSAGGLYDSTLDPSVGAAWGESAKVGSFRDSSIRSAQTLLRRARAFFKLHRAPIEMFSVKIAPEEITYFQPGDSIQVVDYETQTDVALRVQSLQRRVTGGREELNVVVGQAKESLVDAITGMVNDLNTQALIPQPIPSMQAPIGAGTHCSKDIYGVWTFNVIDGKTINRVVLNGLTVPWHITARGGVLSSTHTHTIQNSSESNAVINSVGNLLGTVTKTNTTINNNTTTPDDFAHRITLTTNTHGDASGFFIEVTLILGGNSPLQFFGPIQINVTARLSDSTTEQLAKFNVTGLDRDNTGANYVTLTSTYPFGLSPSDISWITLTIRNQNKYEPVTLDTYEMRVWKVPRHTHGVGTYSNTADGAHTHNPEFGIWQFDGDSGNGTGSPVYGSGIQIWVDPPETAAGIPDSGHANFNKQKLPVVFGDRTKPVQLDSVDITGYLSTESPGHIKEGLHKIFVKSAADTNNAQGLTTLQLSAAMTRKEVSRNK